jgi:hypothetical protein
MEIKTLSFRMHPYCDIVATTKKRIAYYLLLEYVSAYSYTSMKLPLGIF